MRRHFLATLFFATLAAVSLNTLSAQEVKKLSADDLKQYLQEGKALLPGRPAERSELELMMVPSKATSIFLPRTVEKWLSEIPSGPHHRHYVREHGCRPRRPRKFCRRMAMLLLVLVALGGVSGKGATRRSSVS